MDIERIGLRRALTMATILTMLAISVKQEKDFPPLDAFIPPINPSLSGGPLHLSSERSLHLGTPLPPGGPHWPSENPVDIDPASATPLPPDTLKPPATPSPLDETPQAPTSPLPPENPLLFPPAPAPSPPPDDPVAIACDNKCILECQYARPVVYVYDLCFRMCRLKCMTVLTRLINKCVDHCAHHHRPSVVFPDGEKMESRLISCVRQCMKHH